VNYLHGVHAYVPYRFRHSPVFDHRTGFGGDGANGNGCVIDGPFASYNISLGPGHALNNTCLTRGFDVSMMPYITSKQVANATVQPTFERFWLELEGNSPILKPHNAGHRIVGGVLADTWSSPGGKLRLRTTEYGLTCVRSAVLSTPCKP
jgi:tyrosinase